MLMPANSAGLSLVPKVSIANSLAHEGLRSTVVEPTAKKGDADVSITAATSSPTPSVTAAARTPDSARAGSAQRASLSCSAMPSRLSRRLRVVERWGVRCDARIGWVENYSVFVPIRAVGGSEALVTSGSRPQVGPELENREGGT